MNEASSARVRSTANPDVLDAGGGPWGLSVAWHLATRHGASVTVMERRSGPGRETSALSAGHLGQVHARRLERVARRYAVQCAAALALRRDPELFVLSGSVTLFERGQSADESHGSFISSGGNKPRDIFSKVVQFNDNLTDVRGRHALKAGIDVQYVEYTDQIASFAGEEFGRYQFTGVDTVCSAGAGGAASRWRSTPASVGPSPTPSSPAWAGPSGTCSTPRRPATKSHAAGRIRI